jgi:hypothetical protein
MLYVCEPTQVSNSAPHPLQQCKTTQLSYRLFAGCTYMYACCWLADVHVMTCASTTQSGNLRGQHQNAECNNIDVCSMILCNRQRRTTNADSRRQSACDLAQRCARTRSHHAFDHIRTSHARPYSATLPGCAAMPLHTARNSTTDVLAPREQCTHLIQATAIAKLCGHSASIKRLYGGNMQRGCRHAFSNTGVRPNLQKACSTCAVYVQAGPLLRPTGMADCMLSCVSQKDALLRSCRAIIPDTCRSTHGDSMPALKTVVCCQSCTACCPHLQLFNATPNCNLPSQQLSPRVLCSCLLPCIECVTTQGSMK